jgi:murein L,D-transpeptidase YcbB/YkuD
MKYLVVNPSWNVPQSIINNEIVPRMQRDPGYLGRNGYQVSLGGGGSAVDPSSIDWSSAGGTGLAIRQKPGRGNSLGRFKFVFPNHFNVYLHDTPSRSLFERAERSFSHGCIRVEKPLDLAVYLLAADPAWTRDALEAALQKGRERVINLPHEVPVHLAYWTVWVDDAGVVQFRKDLYGRDKPLLEMLHPGNTATSEPSARKAEPGSVARGAAKAGP